jgi:site-specific DNA recombinase
MAVAIYCRVSTEEQRERQSILTQREFGDRYTALHNLAVFRVYADDGISGTVPLEQRSEGRQVLKDARLGKFNQLLIYKLDRLGRETRLILNAVAELEKLGVRVRSMTEEFDTASATGRLMLTMLSGFATHEREVIRERSVAGTFRVAEAGAWLGGIVPYGYRQDGEKRNARLVISDDPVLGLAMSEADVIREIFKMSAIGRKSCRAIASRLNDLRVPSAYIRDDRMMLRGKRRERTSGIWQPGRVRGLITNKTYMGIHEFGKRTKSGRPIISRAVPAIVTPEVWRKAQANLKAHLICSKRNAKYLYLLRGLIKCGLCNRTYVGLGANKPNGKPEFYYRCNGAHSQAIFGSPELRCTAKPIRGDYLEEQVWSDVETFLRNPESVLKQLHERLTLDVEDSDQTQKHIARLEGLLAQKTTERSRVVGLFRRGRLSDAELDAQMDEIGKEETALQAQVEELRGKVTNADSISATVASAEALLSQLRKRLDQPVSPDEKRRLIEILVAGVRVDTVESCGVKQAKIIVTYRFSQPGRSMPLTLPRSYSPNTCVRIPVELRTIGDHIRRRRLTLKLKQKHVAEQLGVDACNIFNWESNTKHPQIRFMPSIIEFLGYNPLPPGKNWAERLVRHRMFLGLSQKEAAARVGVDQGTLARWERGERVPEGRCMKLAKRFLGDGRPEPGAWGKMKVGGSPPRLQATGGMIFKAQG